MHLREMVHIALLVCIGSLSASIPVAEVSVKLPAFLDESDVCVIINLDE